MSQVSRIVFSFVRIVKAEMEERADTADISVLQGNQQQLSFFKILSKWPKIHETTQTQ